MTRRSIIDGSVEADPRTDASGVSRSARRATTPVCAMDSGHCAPTRSRVQGHDHGCFTLEAGLDIWRGTRPSPHGFVQGQGTLRRAQARTSVPGEAMDASGEDSRPAPLRPAHRREDPSDRGFWVRHALEGIRTLASSSATTRLSRVGRTRARGLPLRAVSPPVSPASPRGLGDVGGYGAQSASASSRPPSQTGASGINCSREIELSRCHPRDRCTERGSRLFHLTCSVL